MNMEYSRKRLLFEKKYLVDYDEDDYMCFYPAMTTMRLLKPHFSA